MRQKALERLKAKILKVLDEVVRSCPKCGAGVPASRNYCRICGAYPV